MAPESWSSFWKGILDKSSEKHKWPKIGHIPLHTPDTFIKIFKFILVNTYKISAESDNFYFSSFLRVPLCLRKMDMTWFLKQGGTLRNGEKGKLSDSAEILYVFTRMNAYEDFDESVRCV